MIGYPSGDKALATAYLGTPEGQRYQRFVQGLRTAIVDFSEDSEKIENDDVAKVHHEAVLPEANSVSSSSLRSEIPNLVGVPTHQLAKHKPVLDLDVDVMVVSSSTKGHHHLYIDREMSWGDYQLLMQIMEHVGLLQPGYVQASRLRGASWLRLPWIKKGRTDSGY